MLSRSPARVSAGTRQGLAALRCAHAGAGHHGSVYCMRPSLWRTARALGGALAPRSNRLHQSPACMLRQRYARAAHSKCSDRVSRCALVHPTTDLQEVSGHDDHAPHSSTRRYGRPHSPPPYPPLLLHRKILTYYKQIRIRDEPLLFKRSRCRRVTQAKSKLHI